MMPSRENHRGNDHAGKRAIALYKATLALETMLGKQAGTTRTRIRHLPIRLRRAISGSRLLGRGRVPEARIPATKNHTAESKQIKYLPA